MSEIFELEATVREQHGSSHSRRMRREQDLIPAVVYGAKKPAMSISLSHNLVKQALQHEAFFSHILTLDIEGEKEKVVVKDIQRHPYKPKVVHMDFTRVRANEKMQRNAPLHFINEDNAPGVKEGGVVSHTLIEAEIECLPANLPEYLEIDLSGLEMGDTLHLSDLTLPKGVELTALQGDEPDDQAVVSIHSPKVDVEPAVEEETAGEESSTKTEQESKTNKDESSES